MQRAQAVGEPVAADRVDHEVDPAARELLGLILPRPVAPDDLVGAGVARHPLLLIGRDDRDRPRAEPLGDLERGGADPAGGAVDEHGLALFEAAAGHQREVGRVVVEDQRRALREVELVGQLEHEERRRHRDLGPAAEHAERGHAVAGAHAGAVGRRADHPADLGYRA